MNLRDLEYLIAIDEERHFNRAARRCYVSQPTLSGQLKKLEEELDILLVERNTRQVVMTEAGTMIADQARKVLVDIKNIRETASAFHDPMAGELKIGLIPTIAPYLLPHIMPTLNTQYPKLKLWLHEYQTHILLEKLRNADIDLLILALPVNTSEFSQIHLFNEPFQLAVSNTDVLAKCNVISLHDINQREMLLLEEGHCLRGQALDVCFMAGADENRGFHASSLETLRHMVSENMGITLIPELAVPTEQNQQQSIHYLAFEKSRPHRKIGMLYRKGSYRESTFTTIAETIKLSLSKLFSEEKLIP
ncbi:MAG: DNA-binding transcriptional regulator OxyR [Gammaproteobacteria bacterium]|nr:DNA-binding transcriptional regulator OxyR [Gammaproteobacteria bacterium]MCW9004253.1 DNA-binding transcriptional regulator OxyR [Gammaproteobacteria bacterium]MCW9055601.1 DNA-binding transcriptional regulator OxyR [Gammaproteobacteria bacterium]